MPSIRFFVEFQKSNGVGGERQRGCGVAQANKKQPNLLLSICYLRPLFQFGGLIWFLIKCCKQNMAASSYMPPSSKGCKAMPCEVCIFKKKKAALIVKTAVANYALIFCRKIPTAATAVFLFMPQGRCFWVIGF